MTDKPTFVKDTRERDGKGWNFKASQNCAGMISAKLDVGDYSIVGLENLVCVERKTIGDLWGTLGNQKNYERFIREWTRAVNHKKFLIIEGTLADVDGGYRFSKVSPENIHGKLISLQIKHGVHVIFAGRTDVARSYARRLLIKLYKYHKDGIL